LFGTILIVIKSDDIFMFVKKFHTIDIITI